jgi:AcrR family transcriptional regulator
MREETTAANKLAIVSALFTRTGYEEFNDIKISDLCRDASVSQASFYNYFPKKSDLLIYYVQLWSVHMTWKITIDKQLRGLRAIEFIFEDTSRSIAENPAIMAEILSFHARWKEKPRSAALTPSEKRIAYPDCNSIEEITAQGIDSMLQSHLLFAVNDGELPVNTPVNLTLPTLRSLFFGIQLMLKRVPLDQITEYCNQQLALVWAGIRQLYTEPEGDKK